MQKQEKDLRAINFEIFGVFPICSILLVFFIKGSSNIFEIAFDLLLLVVLMGIFIGWIFVKKAYYIFSYQRLMQRYNDVIEQYDTLAITYYNIKPKEYYEHNYQLCVLKVAILQTTSKTWKKPLVHQLKELINNQEKFESL